MTLKPLLLLAKIWLTNLDINIQVTLQLYADSQVGKDWINLLTLFKTD